MHGVTWTPGGSVQPPTSNGCNALRPTIDSTGRTRRISLITASRYASSPVRTRARTSGWRASRSSAQPSAPCGRLVAGGQQRDELVAHLPAGGRRAVLVARLAQHGEHGPVVDPAVDPLVDQRVEPLDRAHERAPRADRLLHQRHRDEPGHRRRHVERAADRVAQPGVAGAEDDAQDHLERERLHALQRPDRPARRPAVELLLGERGDRVAPARERLAVERREHQPPLAQVLGAVQQQDRVRAGERLQHARALAAAEHLGVGGEHALDVRGIGHEHHRSVRPCDLERERLAVASVAAAQQRRRPHDPLGHLDRGRLARPGRQRHGTYLPVPLY